MKLYVAGVRHHDPLGRPRLAKWLNAVGAVEQAAPAFVAVEYDAEFHSRIVAKRGRLYMNAQYSWPTASPEELKQLSLALGFDGDTHVDVFPGVQTVWYDPTTDANRVEDDDVNSYHLGVIGNYEEWLRQLPATEIITNLPEALSRGAWTGNDAREPDRDHYLAESIIQAVAVRNGGYGIVITGTSHVSDETGSMVDILRSRSIECVVTILDQGYYL